VKLEKVSKTPCMRLLYYGNRVKSMGSRGQVGKRKESCAHQENSKIKNNRRREVIERDGLFLATEASHIILGKRKNRKRRERSSIRS